MSEPQVLFILIVCVLMMATGTTDPVRRATDKGWKEALPLLTIPGSAGPDNDGDAIYCEVYGGTACGTWYTLSLQSGDECTIGEASKLSVKMALDNCTQLAAGEVWGECNAVFSACASCSDACKEAAIQDVKDTILPASYFVFVLCAYLAIVVLWNNIMIASDDLEGPKKIIGMVLNAGLVLLSFVMVIISALAMSSAGEACQNTDGGCVPDTLWGLIAIGLGLMVVGGVCLAGVQINNHLLLRIGTLVMVFLSLICLLTGLIMGISSGAVMDDMEYYYDSNYPRLRGALERADNSYCKLRKDDCTALASNNAGAGVPPKICNEDYTECEAIEGAELMTSAAAWRNMWSVAALEASDPANVQAQPWLEVCETSGICIFCDEFYTDVASNLLEQKDANNQPVLCAGGDTAADPSDDVACLLAPNLDWKDAVTPPDVNATVEERWTAALTPHGNKQKLKCAQTATYCSVADSTGFDDAGTGWADTIANYTMQKGTAWLGGKTKCEMALIAHTAVSEGSSCKGADNLVPQGDAGVYMADCDACNESPDFTFSSGVGSSYCLSYFVGHMEDACVSEAGAATCQAEFYGATAGGSQPLVTPEAAREHVEYFVERAYEAGGVGDVGTAEAGQASNFCAYTDEGCKAKIKHSVEGSMTTIGTIGLIFIGFFLVIIYLTLQGIKIYKGGDDGDEEEDVEEGSDE
jgi:hypothetical protein